MVILRSLGLLLLVLLIALASLFPGETVRADIVTLKDGYSFSGKVKRENEVVIEPGGVPIEIPKQFFLVDDVVRRVIFGSRQVEEVEPGDPTAEADVVQLRRQVINLDNWNAPSPMQILGVTSWDRNWDRKVQVRGPNGAFAIDQRLTYLHPYYVRADSNRYRWSVHYLTREYDPATIRELLVAHPDMKLVGDDKDSLKRFRIFRFLLQAGWYDAAAKELDGIAQDLPQEKEKIDAAREQVRKLRLGELMQGVQVAHDAGRTQAVRNVLEAMPQLGVDEKQRAKLVALQSQYTAARERQLLAQQFLTLLPPQIEETPKREAFTQAAAVILAELTQETTGRLDAFVALAQQAERDQKQDRKPGHGPEQLMALAVSGWLLGNSVADTRVDVALRLWRARQFVQSYLQTASALERKQKLQAYQKENTSTVDEITQMLRLLPPPEEGGNGQQCAGQWAAVTSGVLTAPLHGLAALAQLPQASCQGLRNPDRPVRLKFQADIPWSQRRGANYWVQLPLEYQPGRLYPVLVALHHAGEGAEEILQRLAPHAAVRGYILIAPSWTRGLRSVYDYTTEEHAAVTEVLWEVHRRFWVDSDRVFLTGFGEGANMAFDVGLAHPHLFAGVLPMGGFPRYFARSYKFNGQYLPFYAVDGDRNAKSPFDIREQYKTWVPRGYPVLYVEYKGRGLEWFAAEWQHAFDWMARKRRASAFPELGRGGGTAISDEYMSMRPGDNRFYWLTAEGMADRNRNDSGTWNPRVLGATMSARMGEGNSVSVMLRGFKRGTIWLGPGMVDFEKPITLRVNGAVQGGKRPIKPSLETLLEDLYQRGDRQRVFWARVDFGV